MNVTFIDNANASRLVFDGLLTLRFVREMEQCIVDVLRRPSPFEIDLSGVREIDIHGIHFLAMLEAFCGGDVTVLDISSAVRDAYQTLAPELGHWLCGSPLDIEVPAMPMQ